MYIRQLDGLRGIAIFFVLLSHTLFYPVFTFFKLGSIGVDMFFTLSGFLITGVLLREREAYLGGRKSAKFRLFCFFYARRFLRIFPLYYLVLIVCYLLNYMPVREVFLWLISFTSNWPMAFWDEYLFQQYSHFWSLAVEEQFYICFPFLLVLPKRISQIRILLIVLIFSGLLCRLLCCLMLADTGVQASYYSTVSSLDALCLGGLLALSKQRLDLWQSRQKIHSLLLFFVLAGILFLISNAFLKHHMIGVVVGRFSTALLTCMLIQGIMSHTLPAFVHKILFASPLVYIGKISYGIYVFHPLLNKIFVEHISARLPVYLSPFLVLISMIILISAVSFELFEKRVLALKRFFR